MRPVACLPPYRAARRPQQPPGNLDDRERRTLRPEAGNAHLREYAKDADYKTGYFGKWHALFEGPDREKLAAERSWDPETAGYLRLVEQLDTNVGTIPRSAGN